MSTLIEQQATRKAQETHKLTSRHKHKLGTENGTYKNATAISKLAGQTNRKSREQQHKMPNASTNLRTRKSKFILVDVLVLCVSLFVLFVVNVGVEGPNVCVYIYIYTCCMHTAEHMHIHICFSCICKYVHVDVNTQGIWGLGSIMLGIHHLPHRMRGDVNL